MLIIGIIGGKLKNQTLDMVARLYLKEGKHTFCYYEDADNDMSFQSAFERANKKQIDVFIAVITPYIVRHMKKSNIRFHILLCLSADVLEKELLSQCRNYLNDRGIIILNADDKRVFPVSITTGTTLITCGFNNKASVTASSVLEDYDMERVQCCIQKTIQTVSGVKLEPQEFAVTISQRSRSISGVLGAVAAAMAGDMEISHMDDCIL